MPVTLRDIAKRLNLSHATVSFVLNERHDVAIPDTTRQRVWQAAKELGYRPNRAARALVMGRTQMLALWMPSPEDGYYGEVFRGLHNLCRSAGYDTIYCEATSDEEGKTPFDWPVDGVIAVDAVHLTHGVQFPREMPLVTVGAYSDERGDHVEVDTGMGTVETVMHLLDAGCRRIAYVASSRQLESPSGRNAAYQKVIRAAGLKSELIICVDDRMESISKAVAEYAAAYGAPDGLFCYSDAAALASLRALHEAGLEVPKDCRLVGFNGMEEMAYVIPSLSSVAQPIAEMTSLGVEFLLNRLREPGMPRQSATLQTRLIVRESSL